MVHSDLIKIGGYVLLAGAALLLVLLPVTMDDWRGSGVEVNCGRALSPKEFPTRIAWESQPIYDVPVLHPAAKRECQDRLGDRHLYGIPLAVVGGVVLVMGFQLEKREFDES